MQIPSNIKRARVLAGKTQQEMAGLLGVKRTTYANWETNTEPDIETIRKIAQILGVKFSQLVSDAGEGTNETNKTVLEIAAIVRLFHESLIKEQDNVKEAHGIAKRAQDHLTIALKKVPDKLDLAKNALPSLKTKNLAE
ncbi:MAG: helix-turn-helix transcriptional regulator [Chitinophagaceae bacterium]|nr:helix-turn-helix transcriptional regulator [Chitinophagaceae bacterium]